MNNVRKAVKFSQVLDYAERHGVTLIVLQRTWRVFRKHNNPVPGMIQVRFKRWVRKSDFDDFKRWIQGG